ncbi:hypothetical protein [Mesorhizobium sp. B4-1-3]|uniref:hypothetical protein n=1 Tax=Mesorhizobium sp. B4-1-3 TaxID=2589889 RepID=UPI0015E32E21|nr:hypothetical protein [Mesorhizobium sp. B4-1-3]
MHRYDIDLDPEGTWSVVDLDTGLTCEIGGLVLEGLRFKIADQLASLLNDMDRQRRRLH